MDLDEEGATTTPNCLDKEPSTCGFAWDDAELQVPACRNGFEGLVAISRFKAKVK